MNSYTNITPLFIKEYLEAKTGIEDLSSKTRRRHIVETRSVAYKLTKTLCKHLSLASIGEIYNKDHATVHYGLRMFDDLKNQFEFKHSKNLHDLCISEISKITDTRENRVFKKLQTIEEAQEDYRNRLLLLTQRYRGIIKEQARKLDMLNNNTIFDKIRNLPADNYKELETQVNKFTQVNAMNFKRKKL